MPSRTIIIVALAISGFLSLAFTLNAMSFSWEKITWEDSYRISTLTGSGKIKFRNKLQLGEAQVNISVRNRKAVLETVVICGFGNTTPSFFHNGWMLINGCLISIPAFDSNVVKYYRPDPDPHLYPHETSYLQFKVKVTELKLYVSGSVANYKVLEIVAGTCPCKAGAYGG